MNRSSRPPACTIPTRIEVGTPRRGVPAPCRRGTLLNGRGDFCSDAPFCSAAARGGDGAGATSLPSGFATNKCGGEFGLLGFFWILALTLPAGADQTIASVSDVDRNPKSAPVAPIQANHWAYQPLSRPHIPQVRAWNWVRNPIDQFILARLEEQRLSPSPPADRISLIRRLSFDLAGLPPTPEEADQFLQDESSHASEHLTDRLLASPRYGERWARHWLDVVRFAESHGFEMNQPRPKAWLYRDYVIRALNEDKPYDQFVFEQLAGDALGADAATGFLVGGPWDQVKSPDINLTLQQRMDELHDMVNTAGTAFLGLTVGCARCHDHKFDPIPQTDYYAVQAVFAGVQHGERTLRTPDHDERMEKAAALRKRIENLEAELIHFAPLADPVSSQSNPAKAPRPTENIEVFEPVAAKFVRFTIRETLSHAEPCLDELEIFSAGDNSRNVALSSAGAKATASGTLPNFEMHRLEHVNDGKPGNDRSWISNEAGRGWVQIEFPQPVVIDKIIWSRDRLGKFKDRVPAVYSIEAAAAPNLWQTVAGRAPPRPPVHPKLTVERIHAIKTKVLRFSILETYGEGEPCIDELEVYTPEYPPRNVALKSFGTRISASGNYQESETHRAEKAIDGKFGADHCWISGQGGQGWIQLEFPEVVTIHRIVWSRDREGKHTDRVPTRYRIDVASDLSRAGRQTRLRTAGSSYKSQISNLKSEIQSQGSAESILAEPNGPPTAETDATGWTVVAGSDDREPFVPNTKLKAVVSSAGLTEAEMKRLSELLPAKHEFENEEKALTAFPAVYAGKFEQPGPTHRLNRGDPMQKGEAVAPGALSRVGSSLALGAETPEEQRRLALARWIIEPKNPLTARVMVNRIWQYHFGQGLVKTPSDFGVNGSCPTHPELLDWLAIEFIASGWSIKAMHRLIVLSSTYRQSSRSNPAALAVDANNQWLWRLSPRRLEAETLRDSVLGVSGNLDLKMGGPGFDLFEPNSNYVRVYIPKKQFGPAEWRRMIYQFKPRMRLDDVFGAFDCPDAGQIAPKRTSSTTPLQALNLLNSPFMVQQAQIFAERLRREAGSNAQAQVRRAFALAFSREPTVPEVETAAKLVDEEGLVPFCRALFNANEFVYVF